MKTRLILFAALAALPAPALADAGNFLLINGTEVALGDVQIRRAGTQGWKPLAAAPSPGGRSNVTFADPDCAFDLQATVAGNAVTWAGVNLCDVKSVTLKSDGAAGPWVDYDAP